MGQTGSSEPIITKVDIETSVRDSTAYARSIGLSSRDCFFLQWAGYNGGALLSARKHELRNDGISARGADCLIRSLKGTRCQSNPSAPSRLPTCLPVPQRR